MAHTRGGWRQRASRPLERRRAGHVGALAEDRNSQRARARRRCVTTRARTDPMPCAALSTSVLFFSSSPSLSLVFQRLQVANPYGAVSAPRHVALRMSRRHAAGPGRDSRGVDGGQRGGGDGGGARVNVGPESPPRFDFPHAPTLDWVSFRLKVARRARNPRWWDLDTESLSPARY